MQTKNSRDLIIIMDESFDTQSISEVKNTDVWIIDSPSNREYYDNSKESSSDNELTIFKARDTSTSGFLQFEDALSEADLHHGFYSGSAGWQRLKIYGMKFSEDLKKLLEDYSINKITDNNNHLLCEKSEK